MSASFSNIQSLHERGIIRICKDDSNKDIVFTCCTDGGVVRWTEAALLGRGKSDMFTLADMTSSCVIWKGNSICLGYTKTDFITNTDFKCIGKVSVDSLGKEELSPIINFQLDATCVDMHGSIVVGGASDYSLKKINISESGKAPERIEIDSEPMWISIDPKGEFVAVSSIDGSVTILKLDPFEVVTTLKKVYPNFGLIDIANPLVTLCWSPDGEELFVPATGMIKTFKRRDWTASQSLKTDKLTENYSTCCINDQGTHLAASTMDNSILVWNLEERKKPTVTQYQRKAPGKTVITSIMFSPFNQRELLIADSNEGICIMHNALEATEEDAIIHDDDEDSVILNRTRKDFLGDEDEDTRMSGDLAAIKRRYNPDANGANALEDFGFTTMEKSMERSLDGPVEKAPTDFGTYIPREVQVPAKPKPIPSMFISGSTPEDLAQRYLKWNRHGVVRSFKSASAKTSSIEIEFHDASIHSEIVLDNFDTNYQLADICPKAVALASREDAEKDKAKRRDEELTTEDDEPVGSSELLILNIGSWDADSRRWKMLLPRGDGAEAVLVSETMVAVLTAKRNVRIFTLAGTQRQIFTHPEPILTGAIFGDRLAIASVSGGPFYEQDDLKNAQFKHTIHEYNFEGKKWYRQKVRRDCSGAYTALPLPVAPATTLEWLEYTNKGSLAAMDSDYTVTVRSACGLWTPIMEGAALVRAKSDAIWPVSVVESPGQIRYLYCRGTNHPIVSLNTPLTIAQWKLPLCAPTTDKTKLEEELLLNELEQSREDVASLDDLQKKQLATIIKMFALACKADKDARAAELATMVTSSKGIQLICTYATKNKKLALAEKVAEIGREGLATKKAEVEAAMKPTKMAGRRSAVFAVPTPSRESFPVHEDEAELVQEDDEEEPQSVATTIGDTSMVFPMERLGKNPFKRDLNTTTDSMDTSSISVFDQLERTPVDVARKRNREEDSASRQPAKKQAKLVFGAVKGKENSDNTITPYSLWLNEREEQLKKKFAGDAADFAKFCVQSFRNLTANEKKEWKNKCEEAKTAEF